MTEAEWLAADDPLMMLDFLQGRASERKLRLFSCACCRRVGRLLGDAGPGSAVVVAERYADGVTGPEALASAEAAAWACLEAIPVSPYDRWAAALAAAMAAAVDYAATHFVPGTMMAARRPPP